MAYRTDGTANFNFFINRQGPRGPQGIQGPEGFSPNVQVEEDQGNTFTLRVTNKDNFFITSNLREHKEDRGGDYIRYDRAGQLMYIGDPDFATTVKAGEVRLSTVDDLTAGSDTVALTPKVYKDDVTSIKTELQGDIAATNLKIDNLDTKVTKIDDNTVKLTGAQDIGGDKTFTEKTTFNQGINTNSVNTLDNEEAIRISSQDIGFNFPLKVKSIQDDDSNTYYLRQGKVVAGDNIQIEDTTDGIKISSSAQGDVTLAGDNSFTGNNTFAGETTFNGHTWTKEQEAVTLNVTSNATFKNAYVTGTLSSLGEISAVSIQAAGIKNNQNNKYYLNQASITAGDNVTIEETAEGVKISSTGGGGTNAGLEGDYCSRYGIVDCPNGILTESTGKVTLNAGVVMQLTETDGLTTNASEMAHDIKSTVDFDLFYTSGSLLEATQVVFSEQEPDNGGDGVLAWYNGSQWQFKSNDTGNVWKSAPAVRLAHIHITDGNITRIDYIGNRHLNKVIPVTVDTQQTISGSKVFKRFRIASEFTGTAQLIFETTNNDKTYVVTPLTVNELGARRIFVGEPSNYQLVLRGTSIVNNLDKKFLVQGSVTAGSDNLVIAETDDGIKLVVNAPTDAQFGQLQESIADLSTKINNLTDRVRALEEQIDGGVASSIYAPEPQQLKEQIVQGTDISENINPVSEDISIIDGE